MVVIYLHNIETHILSHELEVLQSPTKKWWPDFHFLLLGSPFLFYSSKSSLVVGGSFVEGSVLFFFFGRTSNMLTCSDLLAIET